MDERRAGASRPHAPRPPGPFLALAPTAHARPRRPSRIPPSSTLHRHRLRAACAPPFLRQAAEPARRSASRPRCVQLPLLTHAARSVLTLLSLQCAVSPRRSSALLERAPLSLQRCMRLSCVALCSRTFLSRRESCSLVPQLQRECLLLACRVSNARTEARAEAGVRQAQRRRRARLNDKATSKSPATVAQRRSLCVKLPLSCARALKPPSSTLRTPRLCLRDRPPPRPTSTASAEVRLSRSSPPSLSPAGTSQSCHKSSSTAPRAVTSPLQRDSGARRMPFAELIG